MSATHPSRRFKINGLSIYPGPNDIRPCGIQNDLWEHVIQTVEAKPSTNIGTLHVEINQRRVEFVAERKFANQKAERFAPTP